MGYPLNPNYLSDRIVCDVDRERERQETLRLQGKFAATCATLGPDQMNDPECLTVLAEEFGEVARAVCEGMSGNSEKGRTQLRKELIETAAVALAWVERIDLGDMHLPLGHSLGDH